MKPALAFVRRALLYVAGWLPVYFFCVFAIGQQSHAPLRWAMFYAADYLSPAVALGFVWWSWAQRRSWSQLRWWQIVLAELGLAVAFVAAWESLFALVLWLQGGSSLVRSVMEQAIVWQINYGLIVYFVHAGVFHTVRITRELRAKELAATEAESLRVRAEMQALRGQLNPHFLFNSLHSITALVRHDPVRAEGALLQFAALLRRVLDVNRDTADEVTLEHELKFVDDYLAIERLRLGDRLRVTRDVSPQALACWLPAFSLQPLVENAIEHAISPRREGGHVTIRGAVRDGRLEISVSDDGPGADADTLAKATGVGLTVVRRRLQVRHGDRAKLTTESAPGGGFTVAMTLPAEAAELIA